LTQLRRVVTLATQFQLAFSRAVPQGNDRKDWVHENDRIRVLFCLHFSFRVASGADTLDSHNHQRRHGGNGAGLHLGYECRELADLGLGGNVGIGTTSPTSLLQLEGWDNVLNLENEDPQYGAGDVLQFGQNQGSTIPIASIRGFLTDGAGAGQRAGNLIFSTTNAGVPADNMSILANGNVGIGTTSPSQLLEVAGNIKVDGTPGTNGVIFPDGTTQTTAFNPALCGGDYAESVDVTGKRAGYEPGDVLVIDPDAPGKFLESAKPYSTLVAGVYSTKPGTVGRRQTTPKSPDEVPMALVGIVPVKVTAENGPIKPGDLLVTSSAPGRAMKGTDREQLTGAVIGKALGSLDSGDGVVEVLVSLR
jgi:hypothetical protein